MKIIFPELDNPLAQAAIRNFPDISFLSAPDLATAAEMLSQHQADSMISGLDYSSRDVVVTYKNYLPLKSPYFSSCFICEKKADILPLPMAALINPLPKINYIL